MKIYSWNVNGIRAVEQKGLLEPFLKTEEPDIVCFQETKAQEEQVVEKFAATYTEYDQFWFSADKKGYSGTAIFTKIKPIEAIFGLPDDLKSDLADIYGDATKEGRVLTLEFPTFFLSNVYTPNAKEDLSRLALRQAWDKAYLTYMLRLSDQKPVIFCGDLNVAHQPIDLARPKENEGKKGFTKEERAGIDAMVESGFHDSLRVFEPLTGELYTWWSHWGNARTRNVGWRIDYFMIHQSLLPHLTGAATHKEILGSDHCPVSINIDL